MATSEIQRTKTINFSALIVKILLIALLGLCLALGGTLLTSTIISSKVIFGTNISPNREANILFIVFVSIFFVTSSLSALSLLKKKISGIFQPVQRESKKKRTHTSSAKYKELINTIDKKQRFMDARKPHSPKKYTSVENITKTEEKNHNKTKKTIHTQNDNEEKNDEIKTPSPNSEAENAFILLFLSRAMEGSKSIKKILDNFNKFGINLWLAGACETFSIARGVDNLSKNAILANSVQVMGFKKSHAASFSQKYEEYLLQDPRYMQMFQSGRNAMNYYLGDESKITIHLDKALTEWNQPKEKEEAPKIITVLFTDIAGSTAITQKLGDAGAQELVRAHNKIVREALHQFHGREIKHTGDGIMASFNQASDSIEAAIIMQRSSAAHNLANPKLPLHLKIGINSGEPIQEENDLFGTMVQLSARIVDKAEGDEILVSETVKGICAGKAYNFQNRGTFPMKGFAGNLSLYDVPWLTGQAA